MNSLSYEIYVRVADFVAENMSDSDVIEKAVSYAKKNNIHTILFDTKDWIVDRAILFYSDSTFVVDGVTIKQANGVFDNIFRSEGLIVDEQNPYGYPKDIIPCKNVNIIGKNGACIEGCDVQPKLLNYVNGNYEEPFGDIWGWRGIPVYFTLCENFDFSGFIVRKTRTWAISFERSVKGYIGDLEIYSDCPNGDGINLRNGCSEITINNIKGITSDDFIAINNCSVYSEYPLMAWKTYLYPIVSSNIFINRGEKSESSDIHHINISNISANSAIMFLARNGYRIYNVNVKNVDDGISFAKRCNTGYMVGAGYANSNYGTCDAEECYLSKIYIDNVETGNCLSSVVFRSRVEGLVVTNVNQKTPGGAVVSILDSDRVVINNCTAVSGVIQNSADNWENPMVNPFFN